MSKTQKLTFAGGGLLAGLGIATALFVIASGELRKEVAAYALDIGLVDEAGPHGPRSYNVQSVIPIGSKEPVQLRMPIDEQYAYQVNVVMNNKTDGTVEVSFNICRETADACADVAKPSLLAGYDQPTSMSFNGAEGRRLAIAMQPTEVELQ